MGCREPLVLTLAMGSSLFRKWACHRMAANGLGIILFRYADWLHESSRTANRTNGWFVDEKRKRLPHPAYIRWQRCEDLLAGNGLVQLPADNEILNTLMVALCDNLSLIQATGGSVDAQKLGDLANYGDEAVQKRLRAVIQVPDQFLDVLVEVACAGWHVWRGHEVKATEEEGMPDLELKIPAWPLPIQAECKCVKNSGFESSLFPSVPKLLDPA